MKRENFYWNLCHSTLHIMLHRCTVPTTNSFWDFISHVNMRARNYILILGHSNCAHAAKWHTRMRAEREEMSQNSLFLREFSFNLPLLRLRPINHSKFSLPANILKALQPTHFKNDQFLKIVTYSLEKTWTKL